MSAKRAPQPAEDDAEEWDPYDIIPDSFDYDTLQEAERAAEADQFELETRKRCPNEDCLSTRIRQKIGSVADQTGRKEGDWKCWGCGNHFDIPKEPLSEEVGKQLRLTEVRR